MYDCLKKIFFFIILTLQLLKIKDNIRVQIKKAFQSTELFAKHGCCTKLAGIVQILE